MKKAMVLTAILLVAVAVMAVPGPDLSGKWTFDKAKSDPIRMGRGGPGGGGGAPGGPPPDIEVTLVIRQSTSDLAIKRTMAFGGGEPRETETKYTLDGKETTVPGMMGRGEMKATAKIDGDKIVIDSKGTFQTQQGDTREVSSHEEYALSADGKVLTITTTRPTPQGDRTSKQVFNKQ
jgi:hypothetical protein